MPSFKSSYKPYDIVTDKTGNVGFISEVSISSSGCKYSVNWLVGNVSKTAWYSISDLTSHCNLFIKIAEQSCHPSGKGKEDVKTLFEYF